MKLEDVESGWIHFDFSFYKEKDKDNIKFKYFSIETEQDFGGRYDTIPVNMTSKEAKQFISIIKKCLSKL